MLKLPAQAVVDRVRTSDGQRIAVIRTSDRGQFRACRRRWNWTSAMRQNLRPVEQAGALWFGTGIHHALEDYHGGGDYEFPEHAFDAYVQATRQTQGEDYILPPDHDDLLKMGYKMMEYYRKIWLKNRSPLKTFVWNGVPQVEVNFIVEVPFPLKEFGYDKWWDKVVYAGTIDRVVVDEHGNLWLVDYKTAAKLTGSHLNNDPQVCTYSWLASKYYGGLPIAGFIYWQFLKKVPKIPKPLKSKKISTAKNQRVSAELYKIALERRYGKLELSPQENVDFYYNLMRQEGPDHDPFIRRTYVSRSQHAIEAEGQLIMMELEDMLNMDMPLYPNRNWMCGMCDWYEPCISLDDGSDWLEQIESYYQVESPNMRTRWKAYLPEPERYSADYDPGDPVDFIIDGIESGEMFADREEARDRELDEERRAVFNGEEEL